MHRLPTADGEHTHAIASVCVCEAYFGSCLFAIYAYSFVATRSSTIVVTHIVNSHYNLSL
eukprot:COSAG06_NODE_1365_length_9687_cov_14.601064_6_plen_60_part_00